MDTLKILHQEEFSPMGLIIHTWTEDLLRTLLVKELEYYVKKNMR